MTFGLAGLILTICSACGTASNVGDTAAAAKDMEQAITGYNSAHAADVAQTVANCRQAAGRLSRDHILANTPSAGKDTSYLAAIRQAYTAAHSGFADCAASRQFDYRGMVRADAELQAANRWILRANAVKPA
ncbi:MAG: hypothetical protein ACR2GA_04930 [Chloroflexota bacterium]